MMRFLAGACIAALCVASVPAQNAALAPAFKTFPATPRAPTGAPNILLVLTDDIGFGATSIFGGGTPTYDALAARGLRYNNFHTVALCSPTRAALLTGRNHHRVGYGALADMTVDQPGYNGVLPASAATIGQVLKANGYDTSWIGKNHNTPPWEATPLRTFRRQKALGLIPAQATMTPRPAAIPAWDTLSLEEKRVSTRMMEAYAAQLAFVDAQLGSVIAELKQLGQYDNTLILYIQGDNGASQEYGIHGANNAYAYLNGNPATPAQMAQAINDLGTRRSSASIPAGWAYAMNAPFPRSKGVASHLGGLKDGLVVSWPARLTGRGEVRRQFTRVTDIAPTIYEAAGITAPETLNNARQMSFDGISFAYSFTQPEAAERHREQYFEMLGDRSVYRDGWLASTTPVKEVWDHGPGHPNPTEFKWELYDLAHDYAQSKNLAARYRDRLAAMKKGFDAAARANNVYPMRADFFTRLSPSVLGAGRHAATFYPGTTRYSANMFPSLANTSWQATAEIDVASGGGDGTLVAQGG